MALTGQLATYETLEVERNFAQQAYTSALSSLEKARVEADRQERYLAVYSTPAVPQYPLYPRRILGDESFKKKSQAVFKEKLPNSRIVMVSHSMSQIRTYCDCGLLLTRGGIWYYAAVEDLIAAYSESMTRTARNS